MSVEEGKVISGLRYKSETEKEEMPDKMHRRGSYCEQWNFNPTGTAEKCRECIPDKTPPPPRVKAGHLSPPTQRTRPWVVDRPPRIFTPLWPVTLALGLSSLTASQSMWHLSRWGAVHLNLSLQKTVPCSCG